GRPAAEVAPYILQPIHCGQNMYLLNIGQQSWEPYRQAGQSVILWRPCLLAGLFQTTAGGCCSLSRLFQPPWHFLSRNWCQNQSLGSGPDCNVYMRLQM